MTQYEDLCSMYANKPVEAVIYSSANIVIYPSVVFQHVVGILQSKVVVIAGSWQFCR